MTEAHARRIAGSLAGAVDLSALKERAESRARAAGAAGDPGGPAAPGGAGTPGSPAGPGATGNGGPVVTVTEDTFEAEVLVRSGQVPVVVVLTSGRSEASSRVATELARLARSGGGQWVCAVIDAETSPRIAQAFGARTVPTVVAVAGGRPLADFEGEQPAEHLRRWTAAVLEATKGKLTGPPVGAPGVDEDEAERTAREAAAAMRARLDAAEQLLAGGDLAAARAAFETVVHADPQEPAGAIGLARVTVHERLAAGGEAGALRSADEFAAAGDIEAAYATLVEGVRAGIGDERATARSRLLELFALCTADDPRIAAARSALASALF